jgi:hypothetical protein
MPAGYNSQSCRFHLSAGVAETHAEVVVWWRGVLAAHAACIVAARDTRGHALARPAACALLAARCCAVPGSAWLACCAAQRGARHASPALAAARSPRTRRGTCACSRLLPVRHHQEGARLCRLRPMLLHGQPAGRDRGGLHTAALHVNTAGGASRHPTQGRDVGPRRCYG